MNSYAKYSGDSEALEKHKKKYGLDEYKPKKKKKKKEQKDFTPYAWLVLVMLILIRVSHGVS